MIAFLLSPLSGYTTAQEIVIGGGLDQTVLPGPFRGAVTMTEEVGMPKRVKQLDRVIIRSRATPVTACSSPGTGSPRSRPRSATTW